MPRIWKEAEDRFLKHNVHLVPFDTLVKGLDPISRSCGGHVRTANAVSHRLSQLGLSRKLIRKNLVSPRVLQDMLKVRADRIQGWIENGLTARRTSDKKQAHYYISLDDLEDFALDNPHLFGGIEESRLAEFMSVESAKTVVRNSPSDKKRAVRVIGGFAYPSIASAARSHKIPPTTIRSAILADRPVRGRKWEFVD